MKHFCEYLGTLLHLVGMLLFVGGHIWFGFLTAMTERRHDREGARFLAAQLPLMATVFGIGVLLLAHFLTIPTILLNDILSSSIMNGRRITSISINSCRSGTNAFA